MSDIVAKKQNSSVISIIFLTTRSHGEMVDDLTRAGIRVWEALSVSEVLYLQEHEAIDAVVVDFGVENAKLAFLRTTSVTLQLEADATAQQIVWELAGLFGSSGLIQ